MSKISLTIYKIRRNIEGVRVNQFEEVIESADGLAVYDLPDELGFEGRLFVSQTDPKIPPWIPYLEQGLETSIDEFDSSPSTSAVLVLKVRVRRADHYFAATFGSSGRFLLRKGAYETDFGLKVALNTIYNSQDDSDMSRIRSVDSKKVAGNVFNSRIQASKTTSFEAFALDTSGDQLRSITGSPFDSDAWGSRITGSVAISIQFGKSFARLGSLCQQLQRVYRKTDYRRDFSWVDDVQAVREKDVRDVLLDELVSILKDEPENLSFVPTALLDWKEVRSFRVVGVRGGAIEHENPEDLLSAFIERFTENDALADLTVAKLKKYRFESLDTNDDAINSIPLLTSIEGEFEFDGQQYLVSEGEFFLVKEDYLFDLNSFVDDIPVYAGTPLPFSTEGENEGPYNGRASLTSSDFLNLDANTVRIPGKTTAIEICDILTRSKQFIHVKRKLSSSNLSHLFAQGAVSADLFLMSPEFRSATRQKIDEVSQSRHDEDSDFAAAFMPFEADQPVPPSQCEVVYAIIAKWGGRSFSQAIPFFSKVNLRRVGSELTRMGYKQSLSAIEVVE